MRRMAAALLLCRCWSRARAESRRSNESKAVSPLRSATAVHIANQVNFLKGLPHSKTWRSSRGSAGGLRELIDFPEPAVINGGFLFLLFRRGESSVITITLPQAKVIPKPGAVRRLTQEIPQEPAGTGWVRRKYK